MDEKWLQNVVSRKESPGVSHKKLIKGEYGLDDDGRSIRNDFHKQALFELPLELTENGVKLLKDAEVSMHCSMPPSRVNGRFAGSFEGRGTIASGTDKSIAKASGSFSLDYVASPSLICHFGMIRGHEMYHPLVTLGGTIFSHEGSSVGATFYHNPSFLHPMLLSHAMYSVSFRHHFPNSRWTFTSQISRTQQVSVAITNSKVNGKIDLNLRKPTSIRFGVAVRPKISEHRRAHVHGSFKLGSRIPAIWQVGASLVQSLHSDVATVGIGLRFISIRGLEWILSWNRGDASVRIPIVISRAMAFSSLGEAMYLSVLSFMIQEAIADMWGWQERDAESESSERSHSLSKDHYIVSTEKAREDAELQCQIMTRQAERKKSEEEAKNGLVIHEAVYEVKGGDSADVTIQLRFWVTRSNLSLPAMSKQCLLGFYNIGSTRDSGNVLTNHTGKSFSWREMWRDLWNKASKEPTKHHSKAPRTVKDDIPTLTVLYEFKRQRYKITVLDYESLILPNPKATRIT